VDLFGVFAAKPQAVVGLVFYRLPFFSGIHVLVRVRKKRNGGPTGAALVSLTRMKQLCELMATTPTVPTVRVEHLAIPMARNDAR
jgi:hypothetical protein